VLEERKKIAISAYKEGFISLGKVAEVLGLDQISARNYLKGHSISLQTQDLSDLRKDTKNA
jgi:predicted HTH domain antitoxin